MSVDTPNSTIIKDDDKEMSLKEVVLAIIRWFKYLKSKALIIIIIAVLGMAIGFARYYFSKPKYLAVSTFVLDEEKKNSSGGLAMLGFGNEAQKGLFQGENLKWLYTTRLMLQRALLSPVSDNGKKELLIDRFLRIDKNAAKLMSIPAYKSLKFTEADANDTTLSLPKSQVINTCVGIIKNKYLKVKDVDKTEGIIEVTIMSYDEQFAKSLADVLVDQVNDYYIQTKTRKIAKQVDELQQQVNEYNSRMNRSMYQTAEAVDAIPYPNPANQVSLIPPKRKGIDAELNSAIYVQMAKTLESSKMELAQATPLIQVIDAPTYPLPISKPGLLINLILGGFIGAFLISVILVLRKAYRDLMAN